MKSVTSGIPGLNARVKTICHEVSGSFRWR